MELVEGKDADFNEVMDLCLICFPQYKAFIETLKKNGSIPWDSHTMSYREGENIVANVTTMTIAFKSGNSAIVCGALGNVTTNPDFRGQGLARDLITRQLEQLGECNVLIFTTIPNLFEKFGFVEVKGPYFKVASTIAEAARYSVRQAILPDEGQIIESMHKKMIEQSDVFLPVRDRNEWDYIYNVYNEPTELYLICEGKSINGYCSVKNFDRVFAITEFFTDGDPNEAMQAVLNFFEIPSVVPEWIKSCLSSKKFSFNETSSPFETIMALERTPLPELSVPALDFF